MAMNRDSVMKLRGSACLLDQWLDCHWRRRNPLRIHGDEGEQGWIVCIFGHWQWCAEMSLSSQCANLLKFKGASVPKLKLTGFGLSAKNCLQHTHISICLHTHTHINLVHPHMLMRRVEEHCNDTQKLKYRKLPLCAQLPHYRLWFLCCVTLLLERKALCVSGQWRSPRWNDRVAHSREPQ